MKKLRIYNICYFTLCVFIIFSVKSCSSSIKLLPKTKEGVWVVVSLQKGVLYKSMLNTNYFGSQQTIHVVKVDLDKCQCKLDIAHADGELIKPSRWAKSKNAVVAINGNFFDPDKGGAVCYFKYFDKLINSSKPDPEQLLFLPMLDEAGITIDEGEVGISEKPKAGWDQLTQPNTILSSGPLLIKNGEILPQENIDFITKKHARTAFGIAPGQIFMVIVDGYRPEAAGMSINELSRLLKEIGSINAINLDGGGSSTLWIDEGHQRGVVNYPTDNKKFDHKGERKVANAVMILPEK